VSEQLAQHTVEGDEQYASVDRHRIPGEEIAAKTSCPTLRLGRLLAFASGVGHSPLPYGGDAVEGTVGSDRRRKAELRSTPKEHPRQDEIGV
jgi:hypothetical protein